MESLRPSSLLVLATAMALPDDFSQCLVLNTVAAARTVLRRYDARLKPFGVTVQQFSLLAAIRYHPGETVAALAQRVHLDRTSLTRNLSLLERKGLTRRLPASGNARPCELTAAGTGLLDQLLPEWRKAQSELMSSVPEDEAVTYLRIAKRLSKD